MPVNYNFCAGPAMLPSAVMQKAQKEFVNWQDMGCSVMELSHRSSAFVQVAEQAEADLRKLMSIPDNYKVLFCHGGGRGQFSAVPLNLLSESGHADYFVTGSWSKAAAKEAQHYGSINVIDAVQYNEGVKSLLPVDKWTFSDNADYVHYCPNETVDGLELFDIPDTGNIPLVADLSSTILSREIDVSRFGVIYAGAQKNIGPSGLTLVIIRDDLLGKARLQTPSILNYQLAADNSSMYNTPPSYAWYLAGLVFEWLIEQGGVNAIEKVNAEKASLLYQCIDQLPLYQNTIVAEQRSLMNVVFQLTDQSLESQFLKEAEAAGLTALKGHRSVGGMRASIYNAMPIEGVQALISFMHAFAERHKTQ